MPHVDGAMLSAVWTAQGQSRFARPVAAITAFVRRHLSSPGATRPAADRETRQHEAPYANASDAHDLERMQRDVDRRDGGGMRPWGWR